MLNSVLRSWVSNTLGHSFGFVAVEGYRTVMQGHVILSWEGSGFQAFLDRDGEIEIPRGGYTLACFLLANDGSDTSRCGP